MDMNWEAEFLLFLQEHVRCGFLTVIFKIATYMGNYGILWISTCVALIAFKKTRRIGLITAAALIINLLICNVIIKSSVGRVRPYEVIEGLKILIREPVDTSFPSGHTSSAFAIACAIICNLQKKRPCVVISLLFIASMIGFSRLYLGVHYPSDVLCGMLFGIITGILTSLLLNKVISRYSLHSSGEDITETEDHN